MKKYELLKDDKHTRVTQGRTLHQIRASRNIAGLGVRKGSLGGWVENKTNLSQDGDCWIEQGASVVGTSQVSDDAFVEKGCRVIDSQLRGKVKVLDKSHLEDSVLSGEVVVRQSTLKGVSLYNRVFVNNSKLGDSVEISGDLLITDSHIQDGVEIVNASGYVVHSTVEHVYIGGLLTLFGDTIGAETDYAVLSTTTIEGHPVTIAYNKPTDSVLLTPLPTSRLKGQLTTYSLNEQHNWLLFEHFKWHSDPKKGQTWPTQTKMSALKPEDALRTLRTLASAN